MVKDVSSWSLEFFFLKFYYSLSSSAGLLTCAFPREPFAPFPKGLAPPSLPRLLPMEHLLTYCTNATTALHRSLSYALTLLRSSTLPLLRFHTFLLTFFYNHGNPFTTQSPHKLRPNTAQGELAGTLPTSWKPFSRSGSSAVTKDFLLPDVYYGRVSLI